MVDECFGDPRLAAVYDAVEGGRKDLDAHLVAAEEFGARCVLDLGCGTGVFALLLADRGIEVVGLDPARASIDVARAKAGSGRVRWIHGDASALPAVGADLATMTGNAAQSIVDPQAWRETLQRVYEVLVPGGRLVFETRDPAFRAWEGWTRGRTHGVADVAGIGVVETWIEVTRVALPLVEFRTTYAFALDGRVLTSDSTLRFRERQEVVAGLLAQGFTVEDIRDAPDRPGRELVFVARRPHVGTIGRT
ncbi:class I SAM-dependent methyltransferase [Nocardiopsis suaedae]|uniref:Class I SAM-dependent methyltransferase n=1 Tax=Nocardiopsis suaedae TaxID=3018444 RepID=A0ABT4THC0_9ACTN|nr:class I SAM-dependent methyltransferase [Nocardiopsis suaedae]MDA2804103.1 class I SAM-dependent methyltransferase [Nocardiopsis suaedae]